MTDGVTVKSLSASFLQRISAATYHLCQIALNQKLFCEFEKWRTFSSHIKAKSHQKKSHKMRPSCRDNRTPPCVQPFATLLQSFSCKLGCNSPATQHGAKTPTDCAPNSLACSNFKRSTFKGPVHVWECQCYFLCSAAFSMWVTTYCSAVSVDLAGL
jgi:hypothetical protein